MRRAEIGIVAFVLAVLHLAIFAAHLPLAQRDLSAYVEPGIYLAETGRIAAPGSQHMDLTTISGYYYYPPGYFLLVAAWVKIFGHGHDSLLALIGVAHFVFTLGLWALVRLRLGVGRLGATLAVASIFAGFNHGRPDVVALMFGTLGWLTCGDRAWRQIAAGVLLAAACLNSPAHGLGACGAVAGFQLAQGEFRGRAWLRVALMAAITAIVLGGVIFAVLSYQHAWEIARVQWKVHTTIRGAELLSWPSVRNLYIVIWCLIPLALLTLPALIQSLFRPGSDPAIRPAAFGYLLGASIQLWLVPADFLTHRHLTYLGRPTFQASLLSSSGWTRRLGILGLLYYFLLTTYFHKNQLWPWINSRDREFASVLALKLPPDVWLATDSQLFPVLYRRDRTLSYEMFLWNRWELYRENTPNNVFNQAVPPDRRFGPVEPDLIVVAAAAIEDVGPPPDNRFLLLTPENLPRKLRLFGIPIRLCGNPFSPVVYLRRDRLADLLPLLKTAGF